jgi:hypothetical protein
MPASDRRTTRLEFDGLTPPYRIRLVPQSLQQNPDCLYAIAQSGLESESDDGVRLRVAEFPLSRADRLEQRNHDLRSCPTALLNSPLSTLIRR